MTGLEANCWLLILKVFVLSPYGPGNESDDLLHFLIVNTISNMRIAKSIIQLTTVLAIAPAAVILAVL